MFFLFFKIDKNKINFIGKSSLFYPFLLSYHSWIRQLYLFLNLASCFFILFLLGIASSIESFKKPIALFVNGQSYQLIDPFHPCLGIFIGLLVCWFMYSFYNVKGFYCSDKSILNCIRLSEDSYFKRFRRVLFYTAQGFPAIMFIIIFLTFSIALPFFSNYPLLINLFLVFLFSLSLFVLITLLLIYSQIRSFRIKVGIFFFQLMFFLVAYIQYLTDKLKNITDLIFIFTLLWAINFLLFSQIKRILKI